MKVNMIRQHDQHYHHTYAHPEHNKKTIAIVELKIKGAGLFSFLHSDQQIIHLTQKHEILSTLHTL